MICSNSLRVLWEVLFRSGTVRAEMLLNFARVDGREWKRIQHHHDRQWRDIDPEWSSLSGGPRRVRKKSCPARNSYLRSLSALAFKVSGPTPSFFSPRYTACAPNVPALSFLLCATSHTSAHICYSVGVTTRNAPSPPSPSVPVIFVPSARYESLHGRFVRISLVQPCGPGGHGFSSLAGQYATGASNKAGSQLSLSGSTGPDFVLPVSVRLCLEYTPPG